VVEERKLTAAFEKVAENLALYIADRIRKPDGAAMFRHGETRRP
jgi:hypothetical protein